jgi:dTDP-4-amino-4,6-dideoxyglucose formyltransferase
MYKSVLIISDNLYLCKQVDRLIKEENYPAVQWSFAISPFSDKATFEKELNRELQVYDMRVESTTALLAESYDLIISIHCKQLFPPALVNKVKCINVHPGYNPINRGWYPQVFAIIYELPVGATIHVMDEQLDHGKIIDRALVEKKSYDTSASLYEKIIEKEMALLKKNLYNIIHGNMMAYKPGEEGNLFLKKDFNALLQIDLDKKMTGLQFINQLRALTHGDHQNAFFLDPTTGKKIFIKISLQPDEDS